MPPPFRDRPERGKGQRMTAIYRIMMPADHDAFVAAGRYEGSADDLRDGYIHMSTTAQVADTLADRKSVV
jgi:uncharacterized protein (DUF952 family)